MSKHNKPKQRSKLSRFYTYKYSGPITVIAIVSIVLLSILYLYSISEFYDSFTCAQLVDYVTMDRVYGDYPSYGNLTMEQREKIAEISQTCIEYGYNIIL